MDKKKQNSAVSHKDHTAITLASNFAGVTFGLALFDAPIGVQIVFAITWVFLVILATTD